MRKSRAVVVGTSAYPYLMGYWLHLFNTVWGDEVDRVYIAVSEPVHPTSFLFTKNLLETNPKITVVNTQKNWPSSLNQCLDMVTEENVMIPHDDLFILKKGVVDKMFEIVETTGKVVSPIHGNYAPPDIINELMQRKYPDQLPMIEEDTGRTGYAFFCNFFFAPMKLLRQTTQDFGGFLVKKGEYSELLDWTPLTTELHADTNFKLGLELLKAGAHFYCPKENDLQTYLPYTLDRVKKVKELKKEGSELFDLPYLHYQTFTYHLGGLYFDMGYREMLSKVRGDEVPRIIENTAKSETATQDLLLKVATIYEFMSLYDYDEGGLSRYHKHALTELEYIKKYHHIKPDDVKTLRTHIREVLLHG